jgi:hypothetical protein
LTPAAADERLVFVRRLSLAFLVSAAMLIAIPGSASASTQIGETFPFNYLNDPPTAIVCGNGFTQLQSEYTAPSDGVITSWSYQADAYIDYGGRFEFKVARPIGGTNFKMIGESPPVHPEMGLLSRYPVRIPVVSGDLIGVYTLEDFECGRIAPTHVVFHTPGDLRPPDTTTFESESGYQLDLAATLEPDADHDGFGDETQEKCQGVAGLGSGCPVPLAHCMGTSATIIGTSGVDSIVGTSGRDVIAARGGNDSISGLSGNDVVCGGTGRDTIKGGKGADALLGGGSADRLYGGAGNDRLFGGTPGGPPGTAINICLGQGGADREHNCQRGSG